MSTRWRRALLITIAGVVLLSGSARWLQGQDERYDLLVRGGRVIDGTGNPWFSGDVGIRGNRIAAVGQLDNASARRVIDATGLVVSPGFIDLHTHSDEPLVADGNAESKVRQGVTIDVLGEGSTVAPGDNLADARWRTFTDYFELLKRQGISMNVISHVSSEQVRRVVLGYETRPATPAELDRMKQLVARSMEEGAWGLVGRFESGGPPYPDEVLALAKVAATYGGNYATHHGSEGYEQDKEIAFAIRVAEEGKMPVHIFHLKIRGEELWPKLRSNVEQIQAARDRGLDVTANLYPYTAMQHGWSACFPLWMREGGPTKFAERLEQAMTDTALREKVKNDPEFIAWSKEHGWWEGIVLGTASTPENRKYEGMSVADIAKQRGDEDPADTIITLLAEEGGNVRGIFHNQSEENVEMVMRQPWVAPASDGSALNLDVAGFPHPRSYGTNVRVLGRYVREKKGLTLEEAVRKMSSLPAQILGLRDRGQIREGFAADVVVFDPATVGDTNSFEKPKSYAKGVLYTIVNGALVIDQGEHSGARPGRPLLGPGYKGTKASSAARP
ncbi:MAG: amidohydrolase family protein [Luteitalea sp.]|nr:amidohydrolase family protein [Luteitalea sp.]